MLQPKNTKYRKPFRQDFTGKAKRGTKINFGEYGLQAKQGVWLEAKQIEAARIAITRYLNRQGNLYIRVFPNLARTQKPLEVRMGKGKGSVDHYVAVVKEKMILFELGGNITEESAVEALRLGMHKLPIKCKIVKKGEED